MAETSPAGAKRMLCGGIFHLPDGRVIESLAEYEIRDGQFLPLNERAGSPPEPKQPAPEPVERRDCLDCAKEPPWRPWQPEIQDEAREGRCGARLLVRTGEQVWDHHACAPVGPCRAWRPKEERASEPTVQGYPPCHPWYYVLGGKPPHLSDIPPNPRDIGDLEFALGHAVKLPEKGPERLVILRKHLVRLRDELARDEARYQDVVERGWDALTDPPALLDRGEDGGCSSLHEALSLTYSHVTVVRAHVLTVERAIQEEGEDMLPGMTNGLLKGRPRASGGGAGRGFEGSAPTVEPGGPAAGGAQSGSPSRAARKPPAKPVQLSLF